MDATLSGSYAGDLAAFLEAWPAFASTAAVDDLRRTEFRRLDAEGHVYLDYAGGGLYAESQVRRHADLLLASVLGNPHSSNPAAAASDQRLEFCRRHVLEFFDASPEEYAVVFTANASHAIKLVGEAYPFGPGASFLLTTDNHTSIHGVREFARGRGAAITYAPIDTGDLRVEAGVVERALTAGGTGPGLFAFPAQSNFSGVQHPLEWIERAQSSGWDVLLDAAAFVPTNRLDLGRWHPDYVALSFYKMFGYPTGVGALLARREALGRLRRPWFAGGTVTAASVRVDRHLMTEGSAAFEDGTVSYATIPAVDIGLDFIESVGIDLIHERVTCLAGWLGGALASLRHDNGEAVVRLYGPATMDRRGGMLTFNVVDQAGEVIDHDVVARRASRARISLRTGVFCNPGAGETALGYSKGALDACFARAAPSMTADHFRRCVDPLQSGAVRVSAGLASTFADVYAMARFAATFANWSPGAVD